MSTTTTRSLTVPEFLSYLFHSDATRGLALDLLVAYPSRPGSERIPLAPWDMGGLS